MEVSMRIVNWRKVSYLAVLLFLLPAVAGAWTTEAVDAPKLFSNFYSRALAVDGSGNPHIAYGQDGLYHAYHDGSSWQYETVDPSGGVGQFASIAIDSTTGFLHISYYDEINGDLKYATNASGSWVIDVADNFLDVGQYSSIALDSAGKVHISYYDSDRWKLKYATNKTDEWVASIVDNITYTGQYTSLAVDSSDYVHISYYGSASLKYATNASGSWALTTVDSSANIVGWYTSIAADTSGTIHISYHDFTDGNLKYATNHGVAPGFGNCTDSNWDCGIVDNGGGGGGGDTGGYSSIAIDGLGTIHISYYDFNNMRLRYATNASGSWSSEPADSAGDVGLYSSISIDSSEMVHISYYEWKEITVNNEEIQIPGEIKYATNASGSWVSEIIDSEGDVGGYTSVATDSSGYVYISYYDWENYDLKYATNASGSWVTETVDNDVDVGVYNSIAVDSSGKTHISYYDYDNGELKYATNASGSWVITMVDNGGGGGDVGVFTDIALDSAGKVHISYNDWKNGDLKYATNASGSWLKEPVDSSADVGWYTSIAVGTSNSLHISYYDYDNGDLKYATGTWGSWNVESVDNTGDVGQDTSIAVESSGTVHISYYDGTNEDLKYATGTFGSWGITTLDSTGDTGWYTSIALDSADAVHISYYDNTQFDIKHITDASGSWVAETVDSAGDVGLYSSIAIGTADTIHISYYDNTNFDLKYANYSADPPSFTLDVTTAGAGSGTVTSSPAGIDCGSDCTEDYTSGTPVTLTPAPNAGSAFAGWSGDADCSDGVVTMDAAKTCTAKFDIDIQYFTLSVSTTGSCSVAVTSSPPGIDCGSDCTEDFTSGTPVTLTAPSSAGCRFDAWTDCDSPSGNVCTMTMDANKSVSAGFVTQYQLTTAISPAGAGSIDTDCSAGCWYDSGMIVVLNAVEDNGYPFNSWTDCDSPSNDVCTMTMDADKNVTAVFDSCQYPVKIFGTAEYFSTLQEAYDFSSDDDIIQSQDTVLTENVHFDRTITVTVQGGYNCDYSAVTGVTTIETVAPEFHMTMDFGSVSIENIQLQ
jgi:hypothetical protein